MIYGAEKLIQWFEMQGRPYYTVYRQNKEQSGNYADTNTDNENETMESAMARLNRWMALQTSGQFFIVAHDSQKTTSKGRAETHFTLSAVAQAVPMQQQPVQGIGSIGMVTMQEVEAKAQEMFNNLIIKHELEKLRLQVKELETQNKQLQQGSQAPIKQFLGAINPYIPNIMAGFGFKPGVNGLPQPTAGPLPNHTDAGTVADERGQEYYQGVVQQFCHKLGEVFPDEWADILVKLTNTLESNPDKIKMALNFL